MLFSPLLMVTRRAVPAGLDAVKSIAVFRYDRIGDMVISTPLFQALKERFPEARLIVVASAVNQEIISANPSVDEVVVFHSYAYAAAALRRRKVELVIDPFYTYEMIQPYLAWRTGARYRLGFSCAGRELFFNLRGPRTDGHGSMYKHLGRLVTPLGVTLEKFEPELFLTAEEISWAQEYLDKLRIAPDALKIAVHPGAHYPSQRWRPEGFVDLVKRIVGRYNAHVFLFGDRKEEPILRYIQDRIWDERVTSFCDMSLRHVMALLNACDLLIGNNSGLLHIASAARVLTVSTMGPTDPVLWQPWGMGHIVIRHQIPCSPCTQGSCGEHWCMNAITCDEVERAVIRQIAKLGKAQER